MVQDTPARKRIALLIIMIALVSFTNTTAFAATTTVKKTVVAKTTTTKSKVATAKKAAPKKVVVKTPVKKVATKVVAKKIAIATTTVKSKTQVKGDTATASQETVIDNPVVNSQTPEVAPIIIPETQSGDTQSPAISIPTVSTQTSTTNTPAIVFLTHGFYSQPIAGQLSQGLHDGDAVDIRAPIGTAVYAAAEGTVTLAKSGYNGGYGNYIIIAHTNGTQTLYAHLSKISVSVGDTITRSQQIGLSGISGHVTGAHLHFAVIGAANPWASDSLGTWYKLQ